LILKIRYPYYFGHFNVCESFCNAYTDITIFSPETIHVADVRGEKQPSVGRQLPARHHRGRRTGRVRHGPSDGTPSRGDRRTHARGAEASARRSQHEHHEQGIQLFCAV